MRVAVFAFFPAAHGSENMAWLQQLLQAMAAHQQVDHLLVYTNEQSLDFLQNDKLTITPVKPARLFWSRWQQERQWRLHVAQQDIDVVFSFGLLSLVTTGLPGVLFLTGDNIGKQLLRKKKKVLDFGSVMVANQRAKQKVLDLIGDTNLQVAVQPGAPPQGTLVETDTQLVKDRFTDGSEYFFYNGPLHDTKSIVHLLKAFSRFKHRQKSGWKLVLLHEVAQVPPPLQELLSNYKYRHDVVVSGLVDSEVVQSLYAAAYCLIHPAPPQYFGTRLLQALSWGLPLIATQACYEWVGDAALYYDSEDEELLAEHLMNLYKDEALRARLAAAAAVRSQQFSWEHLIEAVLNTCSQCK